MRGQTGKVAINTTPLRMENAPAAQSLNGVSQEGSQRLKRRYANIIIKGTKVAAATLHPEPRRFGLIAALNDLIISSYRLLSIFLRLLSFLCVMSAQTDLVEVLGRFDPKLVKMCPAGGRAEIDTSLFGELSSSSARSLTKCRGTPQLLIGIYN